VSEEQKLRTRQNKDGESNLIWPQLENKTLKGYLSKKLLEKSERRSMLEERSLQAQQKKSRKSELDLLLSDTRNITPQNQQNDKFSIVHYGSK
jgi:hypothetical protein